MTTDNEYVECAHNQIARKSICVGYCVHHKCYLTLNHLKNMKCLQKKCIHLVKIKHKYWEEKERKKKLKKEAKNDFKRHN